MYTWSRWFYKCGPLHTTRQKMLSVQEVRLRCLGVTEDLRMITRRAFSNIRQMFAKPPKEQLEMDRDANEVLTSCKVNFNTIPNHKHDELHCWCNSEVAEIEARRKAFMDKYRLYGQAAGESDEAIEDHVQWALLSIPKFQLPADMLSTYRSCTSDVQHAR